VRNRIDASFLDGLSSDKRPTKPPCTYGRTRHRRPPDELPRRGIGAVLSDDPIGRIIASHMSPAARR
jgi:hypothetical protein